MRFKTYISRAAHTEFATCVGWITPEELVSCGDDHRLIFWNVLTHEPTKKVDLPPDLFPTDIHCFPKSVTSGKQKQVTAELFALGATDGKYHLIARTGRIEKSVEAHQGAVLSVRWSYDGSALASAGEDGQVKIWSKSGMLRSTLCSHPIPSYSLSWSPYSDQVIYTIETRLEIKPLSPNAKPLQWKAHEGLILKVSWNANNNMIASCGEDCRYKVWDSLGRSLFVSSSHEYPLTSLSWSPDGSLFAVGSFNTLKLCDAAGWSYSLDKPQIQSIFNLSWSSDSTQVGGSCGSGSVVFAYVVEKRIEWKSFEVTAAGRKLIQVKNVSTNVQEDIDFRDNIIKFSMEFGFLLVITTTQCYIYRTTNWNTPHIFDLKDPSITLLLQCDRHFLLVDAISVSLYSYEGRHLLNLKWGGMRIDALNTSTLSLSVDTVAIRDASDSKVIHFLDAQTGKSIGSQPFKHKLEVTAIALDFRGPSSDRKCAFIDKNAELYLTLVRASPMLMLQTVKLNSMVKSILWNEDASILAGFRENNKLVIWLYPHVAFVDRELLPVAIFEKEASEFGNKSLTLLGFQNNRLTIRRSDGSLVASSINPFATLLHAYATQNQWKECLRLCRYLKDNLDSGALWSSLAGMALYGRQLQVAEAAYAAIERVDKVFYIQRIQALDNKDARNAEIALICGHIREAESILLQFGYVLRAVTLNLELYNWDRALELAGKHPKYMPLVLAYRQKYLEKFNKNEDNKKFQSVSDEVDLPEWPQVEESMKDPYSDRIEPQAAKKRR